MRNFINKRATKQIHGLTDKTIRGWCEMYENTTHAIIDFNGVNKVEELRVFSDSGALQSTVELLQSHEVDYVKFYHDANETEYTYFTATDTYYLADLKNELLSVIDALIDTGYTDENKFISVLKEVFKDNTDLDESDFLTAAEFASDLYEHSVYTALTYLGATSYDMMQVAEKLGL